MELPCGIVRFETFDWNLWFGDLSLRGTFARELSLENYRLIFFLRDPSFGNFRYGKFALEPSPWNLRLGTFAWTPEFGNIRLGTSAQKVPSLGNFGLGSCLGSLAWDLWLGIFR